MPRMSVPMRVRRRQSDAKWRASVATCYDTLKHIIPNNEKMSKRKISKALILQQTEKHIENLENTLRDLLVKKARSRNKVVLYDNKLGMVEANLDDVKSDFSYRQKPLYYQSSMQRKKSSIPSDVETGLVNLRSTVCNLSVLPLEILQQQQIDPKIPMDQTDSEVTIATSNIPEEDSDKNVPVIQISDDGNPHVLNAGPSVIVLNVDDHNNIQSMNVEETAPYFSAMESLLKTPVKSRHTTVKPRKRLRSTMNNIKTENFIDEEELPVHLEQHVTITPFKDKPVQFTPKQRVKDSNRKLVTPKRRMKQSPYVEGSSTTTGFTPIKLPDNIIFDTPSKLQQSVQSPMFSTWSFVGTPGGSSDNCVEEGELDSEEIDVASLLCTEDINQMDLGDEDNSDHEDYRTPYNQERMKVKQEKMIRDRKQRKTNLSPPEHCEKRTNIPGSNCRRQLEKCFSKDETALPVINGVFESTDSGCLDFDGYFLFYQHVANEEKEIKSVNEMASKVSHMWRKMSEEDKNTFVAMAALESTHSQSDSSNLSEDLIDLKMDPFLKETNTDDNAELSSQETMSQEVPDLNSELTNQMEDHVFLANETKDDESTTGDQIYTLPALETSEVLSFSSHLNFDTQLVPGGEDMDTEIIEIETQVLSFPTKIDYSNVDELELFALSYKHKSPSPDIVEEFVDQDWNSQIVPDFDLSSLGESI